MSFSELEVKKFKLDFEKAYGDSKPETIIAALDQQLSMHKKYLIILWISLIVFIPMIMIPLLNLIVLILIPALIFSIYSQKKAIKKITSYKQTILNPAAD